MLALIPFVIPAKAGNQLILQSPFATLRKSYWDSTRQSSQNHQIHSVCLNSFCHPREGGEPAYITISIRHLERTTAIQSLSSPRGSLIETDVVIQSKPSINKNWFPAFAGMTKGSRNDNRERRQQGIRQCAIYGCF